MYSKDSAEQGAVRLGLRRGVVCGRGRGKRPSAATEDADTCAGDGPGCVCGLGWAGRRVPTACPCGHKLRALGGWVCWTYSQHCQIPDRKPSKRSMERRISWVSYMCWVDFHNGILGCGFFCARLISVCVSFSGSLSQRGLPRPTALFSGYHAEGYHARTDAFKLTGYHVCRVTTPELPRSK